jgi:hypothetical protein
MRTMQIKERERGVGIIRPIVIMRSFIGLYILDKTQRRIIKIMILCYTSIMIQKELFNMKIISILIIFVFLHCFTPSKEQIEKHDCQLDKQITKALILAFLVNPPKTQEEKDSYDGGFQASAIKIRKNCSK